MPGVVVGPRVTSSDARVTSSRAYGWMGTVDVYGYYSGMDGMLGGMQASKNKTTTQQHEKDQHFHFEEEGICVLRFAFLILLKSSEGRSALVCLPWEGRRPV
jgi:hypothetical protein